MGNGHGSETSSKPPDKKPRSKIITNTPYLRALFQKLAQKSGEVPENDLEHTRVCQTVFEDAFNGPLKVLGRLLFTHIKLHSKGEKRSYIQLDEFLEVATGVMSVITDTQQMKYYFDMFAEGKDHLTLEGAYHMIQVIFAVSVEVAYLTFDQSEDNDKLMRSMSVSLMGSGTSISKSDFITWSTKHIPNIFNGVHSFLLIKLSGADFSDMSWHQRMSQGNLSQTSLSLIASLEEGSATLSPCILWLLSASLPNQFVLEQKAAPGAKVSMVPNFLMSRLQLLIEKNAWTRLYCSNMDGLSVNRFENFVFAYKGATITLFSFENNLYALATEQEWRDSCTMWGSETSTLIQLRPRFSFVDNGRMIYVNHHTRGNFKGIKIGSDYKNPVLKIEDMSKVTHRGVDLVLEQVEVWGCADKTIKEIQLKQRQWERKEVERLNSRKLKQENWEDNPDRMLLNWGGITTDHNQKVYSFHIWTGEDQLTEHEGASRQGRRLSEFA